MDIKKPNRVSRTFTQHLIAGSDRVFPLLCPVREADWIEGWDPIVILSESGLAEPDCVFMTPGPTTPALWFITRHEPTDGYVEMIKITPDVTACRLTIQLTSSDSACEATITYAHTSLGPQGDAFVASFTEEFYEQFMRDWEARMNHYLKTGQKLTTS